MRQTHQCRLESGKRRRRYSEEKQNKLVDGKYTEFTILNLHSHI